AAADAADPIPRTPASNVAFTATLSSLLLFASRVTLQLFHVSGLGVAILHILQDELAAVIEALGLERLLLRQRLRVAVLAVLGRHACLLRISEHLRCRFREANPRTKPEGENGQSTRSAKRHVLFSSGATEAARLRLAHCGTRQGENHRRRANQHCPVHEMPPSEVVVALRRVRRVYG